MEDLSALASIQCSTIDELRAHLYRGCGAPKLAQRKIGYISFPTNYSSSAFVTHSAVVLDDETKYKFSAFGAGLRPDRAYVDPQILAFLDERRWKLSAVDILTHFVEIYWSMDPGNHLYFLSLKGWLEDFVRAVTLKDFEKLFFLSAHLMGGFFPLKYVNWPIHALAHSLGPREGIDHASSLSCLLPGFLDAYIAKQQAHTEVLRRCKDFFYSLSLPPIKASVSTLDLALETAINLNARLFEGANSRDSYREILGHPWPKKN